MNALSPLTRHKYLVKSILQPFPTFKNLDKEKGKGLSSKHIINHRARANASIQIVL